MSAGGTSSSDRDSAAARDTGEATNDCANAGAAEEIACADAIRFLDSYLDGTMPTERRRAFEAHLAICPQCIEYIASYRRTIELAQDATGADVAAASTTAADVPTSVPPRPLPPELVRLILAQRPR